ncbi:hypothetical protein DY000_02034044 [Brassica cretica]|uniref:F-box domain-containing protein n=1 Tax=Brassica cretica TaxID=69181 RepID=A0ABQ7DUN9_BRACR|nr:hypothetical protein DY000_02034044 [Brassica cretica]
MAQIPGGDRNKKRQEEEVKKSFAHLPYDLTEHCLAITPRRHYPNLSLASKSFRRILRSPELYQRRSTLGVTEPVLYASIGFLPPKPRAGTLSTATTFLYASARSHHSLPAS